MFAIGEPVDVCEVPYNAKTTLITDRFDTAIVREYTFEKLLDQREAHPDAMGRFARLSPEELHRELDGYDWFLVEVGEEDYDLVVGYTEPKNRPQKNPTVLYSVPQERPVLRWWVLDEGGIEN